MNQKEIVAELEKDLETNKQKLSMIEQEISAFSETKKQLTALREKQRVIWGAEEQRTLEIAKQFSDHPAHFKGGASHDIKKELTLIQEKLDPNHNASVDAGSVCWKQYHKLIAEDKVMNELHQKLDNLDIGGKPSTINQKKLEDLERDADWSKNHINQITLSIEKAKTSKGFIIQYAKQEAERKRTEQKNKVREEINAKIEEAILNKFGLKA